MRERTAKILRALADVDPVAGLCVGLIPASIIFIIFMKIYGHGIKMFLAIGITILILCVIIYALSRWAMSPNKKDKGGLHG